MNEWNIEELTGYKKISTFWEDMAIADIFGTEAIKETYDRIFNEWQYNYKMITEFCMVLNHRCWYWYGLYDKLKKDQFQKISILYSALYYKLDDWCLKNLKGEELEYYIKTTD